VGQALGANPVPILIPCHRVISSAGSMGGFSGGIGMKKQLLELEKGKLRG
jgi:methylated-DNA-[protein]-cysteine S-methyltransferase